MDFPFCGDEILTEIEIGPDREFYAQFCCSEAESIMHEMDRKTWANILRECAGIKIRQPFDAGLTWQLDFGLEIVTVEQRDAKDFIRKWHRHNPPPAGWKFGFGIANGADLIGVCWVGRPVARMLDHKTIIEVNRLCVRDDLPKALTWNACSQMYGEAARNAQAMGYQKIITYTLITEEGTALKAAGWQKELVSSGGTWDRPSRYRKQKSPTVPKIRWAKYLVSV